MIKQIKRLQYKLSKDRFYVDKEDRKALNEIIDYYNATERYNIKKNEFFAKLWMNEFLKLTVLSDFSSKRAVERIDNILSKDIDTFYDIFCDEIKWIRFRKKCKEMGIKDRFKVENPELVSIIDDDDEQKNKDLINKHHKELTDALFEDYTKEEMKSFFHRYMNVMILDHGN